MDYYRGEWGNKNEPVWLRGGIILSVWVVGNWNTTLPNIDNLKLKHDGTKYR